MPVGELYEVTFQYAIESREFNSVFGYKMTAGTAIDEVCQNLAKEYATALQLAWQNVLATDVSLQCVIARAITANQAIPGVINFDAGTSGLGSGNAIPAVSAAVAKFLTDNALARHNGRKYIAGIPEGFLVSGVLSAAVLAGVLDAWAVAHEANITVTVSGDEVFTPVVINRRANLLPIIPPTSSDVTTIVPLPTIYQQLGRKTKRTQIA